MNNPLSSDNNVVVKVIRVDPKYKTAHDSPKVLVNPYHGCAHRCLFCPANDGFLRRRAFDEFRDKGIVYVIENIIDHISAYLVLHPEAKIVHLSPVSDPFQPVEDRFKLSLAAMKYCTTKNIPIAICTKGIVPTDAQDLLTRHPFSFAQISIVSLKEEKRRFIVRGGGASIGDLLSSISNMVSKNILVIARVDPIYPYITDDFNEFERLAVMLKECGVRHIVSSVADIIPGALDRELKYLNSYENGLGNKYRELYVDEIGGRYHAAIAYRRKVFEQLSVICRGLNMGFGITWEPDQKGASLAKEFSFGIPEYFRQHLI